MLMPFTALHSKIQVDARSKITSRAFNVKHSYTSIENPVNKKFQRSSTHMQIKKFPNTEKSSGAKILLPQSVRKAFNHKLQRTKSNKTQVNQEKRANRKAMNQAMNHIVEACADKPVRKPI